MRKIAMIMVIVLTITFSFNASHTKVEAVTGAVVAEAVMHALIGMVVGFAASTIADAMMDAGIEEALIDADSMERFLYDNYDFILLAGMVSIVHKVNQSELLSFDVSPDESDTDGNMAYDLVMQEPSVNEKKADFLDWYTNNVKYVGTFPDGYYEVTKQEWSNYTGKYYSVIVNYNTLDEAFQGFPVEYQALMHELGTDWVDWYSSIWERYQVDNDLVEAGIEITGPSGLTADQLYASPTSMFNSNNTGYDNYHVIYQYYPGSSNKTKRFYLMYWNGPDNSYTSGTGSSFEWRSGDTTNGYVYRDLYDFVVSDGYTNGSYVKQNQQLYDHDSTIRGGSTSDPPEILSSYSGGLSTGNTSAEYTQMDIPINTDEGITSHAGTVVDVGFEEDENGDLVATPGDVPGVTLPEVGVDTGVTQEDLTKQGNSILQKIESWMETLVESNSIIEEEDPNKKPTGDFSLPTIPNLLYLLVLILIQILLLFIKGFLLVGLIFRIPVSTALFHPDTLTAIEKTKEITLGGFNLTIHELLSWVVAFVFTFILLKTLKRHLDTFRVT